MNHDTLPAVPKSLIVLLAIVCGVAVASAYYAQPLLGDIGRAFGVPESHAAVIPMFTQIGIAIGALLFLPLGDIVNDRKLILTMATAHVVMLALVALAPNLHGLIWACAFMGISTITPYLLPAYAAKIIDPARRGHVMGLLARGIFFGILLARTASGYVGHYFHWNTIYWIASALMLLMTLLLALILPSTKPSSTLRYPELLASLWTVFKAQPLLRHAAIRQGLLFGSFNAFWISLVFFLETPQFHMGSDKAGLFGIVGVAGAFAAPLFGKLADKRGAQFSMRIGTMISLLSWLIFALFGSHVAGLIAGVLLLDLGVTASHVSNQTIIYHLGAEIRSRVTTIYVLGAFVGGALMSGMTAWIWSTFGWYGVCALGVAATSTACLFSYMDGSTRSRSV